MSRDYVFRPFRKEGAWTAYVAACGLSREAMVVDPGNAEQEIRAYLQSENLKLRHVVLTGAAGEHGEAAVRLTDGTDVRIVAHPDAIPPKGGREVRGGDEIILGRLRVEVLETPGGPAGSMCYHLPFGPGAMGSVLTGGVLYAGAVGGIRGDGDARRAAESVRMVLLPLGDAVRVYPGKGPATTMGVERHHNPYL
ncbi:MAG: hypothetical protein JW909_12545 [Planctomycetes bacterium]|nr:hypothetical protein [Planctomycetota bacterium]